MLREPDRVVRVVEEQEFSKLLTACDYPVFKGLLIVAYRQGLRRGELINLRWPAIGLEHNVLHVVNVPEAGELTKSRKNRSLPMHPLVREVLNQFWQETPKRVEGGEILPSHPYVFCWPGGRPLKRDWVCREFSKLLSKAGVSACTLHDFRRSFSTLAQRAGVDKHIVKDLGGWSVVSVVEKHYTGEIDEVYRRAMDKIIGSA